MVTTNTCDSTTGRITSQVDGDGAKATYSWNAAEGESDMTDPDGGVWTDLYGGNVLTESIGPLTEVAIPNTVVEQLNDYPRTWHR